MATRIASWAGTLRAANAKTSAASTKPSKDAIFMMLSRTAPTRLVIRLLRHELFRSPRKCFGPQSTCNIEIDTIDRALRILQLEFTLGRTRADSSAGQTLALCDNRDKSRVYLGCNFAAGIFTIHVVLCTVPTLCALVQPTFSFVCS